ncbi:MAG: hypothetical protein K0R29_832 [Pseudobdellovibrio sp.]|nr:hypothetical protein [Pseudobdellovibrio sp.]
MSGRVPHLLLNISFATLVFIAAAFVHADEGDDGSATVAGDSQVVTEAEDGDDQSEAASTAASSYVPAATATVTTTATAPSRQPASIAAAPAYTPEFESFLENQTQELPSDSLGLAQFRTAGTFGAKTESESYSSSELNHGPAMGMNYDSVSSLRHDSGFMRRGMAQYLDDRIVANAHVMNLFERYASLRSESGVVLPPTFAPLINFVEQYIKSNALSNAEANNGFSHRTLAINVVRASFCFGNDPFMILAKMRRETNFSRRSVSPTGAVGFSQMTGIGVKEVQHQLSGDERISLPAARTAFQQSVRCFSGLSNFEVQRTSTENLKNRIREKWGFDMVFGQILVKTLVSNAKSSQSYGNNTGGVVAAYEDAFTVYNGDTQITQGACTGRRTVQMREEYACDVISQFNRMNAQWNRYIMRSTGKDLT